MVNSDSDDDVYDDLEFDANSEADDGLDEDLLDALDEDLTAAVAAEGTEGDEVRGCAVFPRGSRIENMPGYRFFVFRRRF